MFGSLHTRRERDRRYASETNVWAAYLAAQDGSGVALHGPIHNEQLETQPTDAEIAAYMRMIAKRKAKK